MYYNLDNVFNETKSSEPIDTVKLSAKQNFAQIINLYRIELIEVDMTIAFAIFATVKKNKCT